MDRDILHALLKTVELKDHCTAAHTWRVALYALALADDAGADVALRDRVVRAAALHDIGKIDIPGEILSKPARLSSEEFAVMQTHTVIGHERLVRMGEDDPLILDLVRSHHERMDGSGYPDSLRGGDIPEVARWFAVIDTFDAITSVRPYRMHVAADAVERAVDELRERAGAWYCPAAVDRFADLIETGRLDWVRACFDDAAAAMSQLDGLPSAEGAARLRAGSRR